MAFSEAQKAQIRMYLGWSDRFHQTDSKLERAFDAIDTRPETQALIESALASIADVETSLTAAHKRLKARKVGAIDLQAEIEIGMLRSEGRRHAGRIAALLGVEVRHDAFSGAGPRHYSTWDGIVPSGSGGGAFPHG